MVNIFRTALTGALFVGIFWLAEITLPSCTKDKAPLSKGTILQPQTLADSIKSDFDVKIDNGPSTGKIFISPVLDSMPGSLFVLDKHGYTVKKKAFSTLVSNFENWTLGGVKRYSFWVENPNGTVQMGVQQGIYILTDTNFQEIERTQLLPYNGISAQYQSDLDSHDFIPISDHHYIEMAYYPEIAQNIPDTLQPAPLVKIYAPIIQEVQDGQVVWQWDGSAFPELYANSLESNNFSSTDTSMTLDYAHMNSMFLDPRDNNLICSFRKLDQVLKIDRRTGAIIWRLGGKNSDFPMTADQVFLRQHDVTLTDSNQTLLLFDNGLMGVRETSRVLEFRLNELAKTIESFKSFEIPEPYTQFTGSVQKQGSNYFIGGGSANYVLEVNYLTGQKLFEIQNVRNSYRALKYDQ